MRTRSPSAARSLVVKLIDSADWFHPEWRACGSERAHTLLTAEVPFWDV